MLYWTTKKQKFLKGFTLIELLVIVALIILISSILAISAKNLRERGRMTRAQADMTDIRNAILVARENEGRALKFITGSNCSECPCRGAGDLSQLSATHPCIISMTNFFNKIGLPLMKDPWGSPYLVDENEYEWDTNPCRGDTLNSAGPDRLYGPAGHDGNGEAYDNDGPRILIPMYICR